MIEFECPICGEKVERPKREDGYIIDYDHTAMFCDEHTSEQIESHISEARGR